MASKKRLWPKFGRFVTGLVVVCFFLPFFGISCSAEGQSMDIIKFSGADMVGGCRPGGLLAQAEEEGGRRGGGGGIKGGEIKIENVDRELFAVLALGFCAAAFALAWLRTRGALIGTFALALAALGSLGGLYVKVNGKLDDAVAEEEKKDKLTGGKTKDVSISAGSRFGFWIVAGGLLLVAGLTGRELAIKDEEGLPSATAREVPPA